MKRILALTLAILLMVSLVCCAAPGKDKVAHFGVGYIINDQLKRHTKLTLFERMLTIGAIAYLKEKHDEHVDKNDIAATLSGGIFYEVRW